MAHCVTARWRNFSHYCRPLSHYDVWLRVLITEKHWQPRRQHTVYRNERLEFATEQVGKLRYVTAVDGGLKRIPWVAWFAHSCSIPNIEMIASCQSSVAYNCYISSEKVCAWVEIWNKTSSFTRWYPDNWDTETRISAQIQYFSLCPPRPLEQWISIHFF